MLLVAGDPLPGEDEAGLLRGHGVLSTEGCLHATTCGRLEKINRLVLVRQLEHRYAAEAGDVVVARVKEAAGKRWRLEVGAQQEAVLQLSAVKLPGTALRRQTAEDELNMRALYTEGDLVCAEVQQVTHDGTVLLHTRSEKYGRVAGGQLVKVASHLVKRQKQHVVQLEGTGLQLVLGCNGWLWLSPQPEGEAQQAAVTLEQRRALCRMAAAVGRLAERGVLVTPAAMVEGFWESAEAKPG